MTVKDMYDFNSMNLEEIGDTIKQLYPQFDTILLDLISEYVREYIAICMWGKDYKDKYR